MGIDPRKACGSVLFDFFDYNFFWVFTPVAGPIFETKNRAIFLERFFGRGITAREQLSRAKNSLDFK